MAKKTVEEQATSTALAEQAKANMLATAAQYADDAGGGFENQTQEDKSMPFLQVLQTGSPQCKPRDPKQITGAIAGMIINTITGELFDGEEGAIVIPVLTDHCFCEWKPRDQGGGGNGFVARHEISSVIVSDARQKATDRNRLKNGNNELVETFYMYGLVQRPKIDLRKGFPDQLSDLIDLDAVGDPVLIPFTSTKIKPYKTITTQTGMFKIPGLPHPQNQPPLWAFPLWFTTALEKRDQGDSFNYRIKFAGGSKIELEKLLPRFDQEKQEHTLYNAARELRRAISAGMVKVDYNKQNADSGEGGQRPSAGGNAPKSDDHVPF